MTGGRAARDGGPDDGAAGTRALRIRELAAGQESPPLHEELDVFRSPGEQGAALTSIAADPHGCVWIAERDGRVVAYVSYHPPGELETWGDDATGRLVELGAIEVAPSLRGERLGERLLAASLADGRFDDTVVFATLYSWHYDLSRTSLTPFAYKRLLEKLYRKEGLVRMPTTDPEIRADAANALMVRVGPRAPAEVVEEFDRLRTRPRGILGA